MHRDPGRRHEHHHDHSHGHGGASHGRNDPPAQWQTPHRPEADEPPTPDTGRDLDLVEQAFTEGFHAAADPTSFLRLSGVQFEGRDENGRRLVLLRVEQERLTDIGSITPQLGGGEFRYDPLPARLSSRRDRLRFLYFDGEQSVSLSFEQARALASAASAG